MLAKQIREYAEQRAFHSQTVERWLGWHEDDGGALLRLTLALKIGENHLRDLMDWLEEIDLRDRCPARETLARKEIADIESNPRLGRADKIKKIKDQVRRLRFPRLAGLEDSIHARLDDLKLKPEIQLRLPPGLEGGRLCVEFSAASHHEFELLVGKLTASLGRKSLIEIFDLLAGASAPLQETPKRPNAGVRT